MKCFCKSVPSKETFLLQIIFLISKIYVQQRSIKLKKTPFLTVGYTKEDFVYFNSWLHHVLEDAEIFIVFYCLHLLDFCNRAKTPAMRNVKYKFSAV